MVRSVRWEELLPVESKQDPLRLLDKLADEEIGGKTKDKTLIEAQIEDFTQADDLKHNLRLSCEFAS